jgi:hypothetical protein
MASYAPIRLAGSQLGDQRHVWTFFDSEEDEYRVMFPFFRDGMARGERGVSIVPRSHSDYREVLRTHPMAIVRGVLQENPCFVPPAQLLELRRRARSRTRSGAIQA